jgi:signal transduction histidine kinase
MPGLCLLLSADLEIVEATDTYLQATMTKREDIIGRQLFDVFPDNPDEPDSTGTANLRASLAEVIRSGKPDTMAVQKYDVRQPEAEGGQFEERFWSPANFPILAPDGSVEFVIHRVEDVTDFVRSSKGIGDGQSRPATVQQLLAGVRVDILKRSEDLKQANRQLTDLNRALTASEATAGALAAELRAANQELEGFTYSVAHDLRGPLRSIGATSRMLLEDCSTELSTEHQAMLERQAFNAGRLAVLIDELLKLARISRQEMAMTEIDLTVIAHDVAQELEGARGAWTGKFTIASGMKALGDPRLLRLVLLNLMQNAVKFSPNAGDIAVSASYEGGTSIYSVADEGIGFDMGRSSHSPCQVRQVFQSKSV